MEPLTHIRWRNKLSHMSLTYLVHCSTECYKASHTHADYTVSHITFKMNPLQPTVYKQYLIVRFFLSSDTNFWLIFSYSDITVRIIGVIVRIDTIFSVSTVYQTPVMHWNWRYHSMNFLNKNKCVKHSVFFSTDE